MTDTIEIRSPEGFTRAFTVEACGKSYMLTGKRGAIYAAVRYINDPDLLHVTDLRGGTPLGSVLLTDITGTLCQMGVAR